MANVLKKIILLIFFASPLFAQNYSIYPDSLLRLTLATDFIVATDADVTIEFWLKRERNGNGITHSYLLHDGGNLDRVLCPASSPYNGILWDPNSGTPAIFYSDSAASDINKWVHFAIVTNVTGTDSTKVYQGAVTGNDTLAKKYAGAADIDINTLFAMSNNTSPYDGYMDEFRIWTTVRTLDQINANKFREIADADTVGLKYYWKFDNSLLSSTTANTLTEAWGTAVYSTDAPFDFDTTKWYIDPISGLDTNFGHNVVGALASFDSINTAGITLQADDDVYLRTGSTIRQQLTVPSSGTSGNVITFSAYDSAATPRYGSSITGAKPIINGSNLITKWVAAGANRWYAVINLFTVWQCFLDGTQGVLQASSAAVDAQDEWFWASNGATDSLFIYTTTPADTNNIEASINYGIRGNGRDYINVNNIAFTHLAYYGIDITNDADNWIVEDCNITYARMAGIHIGLVAQCSNSLIQNNTIGYCGQSGIQLDAYADACTLSTNVISYCGIGPSETSQSGIKLWGNTTATCNNNIVEYNNVSYCGDGSGISDQKGVGLWIDQCYNTVGNSNILRYNYVHDNYGPGIYIEKTSHNLIYYNILNNNMLSSEGYVANLSIDAAASSQRSDSNYVYNNTVYTANNIVLQVRTFNTGTATGNILKNNIGIHTGAGLILSCVSGGANNVTDGSGNIYENNCFGAEYAGFIKWAGTARDTYDAYIAASSQADNNVESDPLFTTAGTDFTLQSTSPCIDAGVDVGLVLDYVGNTVPFNLLVDIGSYEYSIFAPSSGINVLGFERYRKYKTYKTYK